MNKLFDWLDDRTGFRDLAHATLYENIPGGARWRYVWGSTLSVTFLVQVVTGLFLWMAYSPSAQTAWESTYYIQERMQGGWLLRGVHHFTAQMMIVLLVLHLMQIVIDGAYRAPREVNFWIGLVLMQIVLALSLTGYLLPWDQKGFWATQVATNLLGLVPWVGEELRQVVVGGPDFGHHTLTRFFALHAGLLPGLLVVLLVLHVALLRRHGVCAKNPAAGPDAPFWPDQLLKDAVACLAVMAAVLTLTLWEHGAELGAPADPASPYAAARPEWYFLFLFQLLKYFSGATEFWGAIVIPALTLALMFLMPLVGRWRLGHRMNVAYLVGLLLAAAFLTAQALHDDYRGSESVAYVQAVADAEAEAERIVELAGAPAGIPPAGALSLLRDDAKTQGPKLFRRHCASCHNYVDATGQDRRWAIVAQEPSASNLYRFASRGWIAGVLDPDSVAGEHYFGNTEHAGGEMIEWVTENIGDVDEEDRVQVAADVEAVTAALSAEAQLKSQADVDARDAEQIAAGRKLITEGFSCIDCHKFGDEGELGTGPELTGYGSRAWLIDFISNPEHKRFYGKTNDRMPSFAEYPDDPDRNQLDARQIGHLVDWLRGEWLGEALSDER